MPAQTASTDGNRNRNRPSKSTDRPRSGTEKPGLEARQAATRLLAAVIDKHVSLDGLTDPENGNPAYRALSPADQALVRAILNAALRHAAEIDAALDGLVDRSLPEGARSLRHILTVGAAQILYLDVPDSAAVDLAVEQTHTDPRARRFASLVNALLRRLSRQGATPSGTLPSDWITQRLREYYGDDHAARIAEAHRHPAPLDITVKSDPEQWAETLGGTALPTGSVRIAGDDRAVTEMPGFDDGAWWVQDAAAAIPARMMGDIAGKDVADLCAAPGGKTAQLANAGANVAAFDLSENRLRRLRANMDRLGLTVETIAGDFRKGGAGRDFDAVLLDAPCSSTGTIRRHPDIPFTKTPADIEKLAKLQADLLAGAAAFVRPGGRMVFSNCSLDPLEGEDVARAFLAAHPDFSLLPVEPQDWPGLEEAVTPEGFMRTTPAMLPGPTPATSGLDGFFACILVRQ